MDERQAFTLLYEQFNLDQLLARLLLANEAVVDAQQRLKLHLLRKEVLEQLIEKQKDRLTKYWSSQGEP